MCAVPDADIGPVEPWRWLDRAGSAGGGAGVGVRSLRQPPVWPFTTQRGNRAEFGGFQARTGDRVGRFPTFDGDQVLRKGAARPRRRPYEAQGSGSPRRSPSSSFAARSALAESPQGSLGSNRGTAHKPRTPGPPCHPKSKTEAYGKYCKGQSKSTSRVRRHAVQSVLRGYVCGAGARRAGRGPPTWDGAESRSPRAAVMRAFDGVPDTERRSVG